MLICMWCVCADTEVEEEDDEDGDSKLVDVSTDSVAAADDSTYEADD